MFVVEFDLMESLRDFACSFRGLPLAPVQVSCQFWRQHYAARGLDFPMAIWDSRVHKNQDFVHH